MPFLPIPLSPNSSTHLAQSWHAATRALACDARSIIATETTDPRRLPGSTSSAFITTIKSSNTSLNRP